MDEIKSTLELALERAQKIEVSSEEREKIRKEKYMSKAKGMANRYLNGELNMNGLTKELNDYEGDARAIIVHALVLVFVDAISLSRDNDRFIEAILNLKENRVRPSIDQIEEISLNFVKEKEDRREKHKGKLRDKFKKMKISGSAVDPKVESDETWSQSIDNLTSEYEAKLTKLKEELLQ